MAINTYLSTIESKKQTEKTRTETKSWNEECFDGCQQEWVVGQWIKKYNKYPLQKPVPEGWGPLLYSIKNILRNPNLESLLLPSTFFFLRFYLFCFQTDGKGGTEGEKQQCVVASRAPPTGDLAHNPGTCPDWKLNQQPFGSQAGTQSTEPHQPGLGFILLKGLKK